ncbi:MAG TPA: hypothetical protein EYP90_12300 [Chromatiaceae bacterium]|nr:hypothetical protein [Chromatiaceae bacterium]
MHIRKVLFTVLLLGLPLTPSYADLIYNPIGGYSWLSFHPPLANNSITGFPDWNGKRIYLSPARHSNAGQRGECPGLLGNENTAAFNVAVRTADDYLDIPGSWWFGNFVLIYKLGLAVRGYQVRVGTGTLASAILNSNTWPADVHIPIHSNARNEGSLGCANANPNTHGAVAVYVSSQGELLADEIIRQYQGVTPGAQDFSCHVSSPCTAFNSLAELNNTSAVAAYLEREFHTWDEGADFLSDGEEYSWLAEAVDAYLGRPR